MSDGTEDVDVDDDGIAEGSPRRKLSGKKLALFIGLPALLLIGGIVGVLSSGVLGGGGGGDAEAVATEGAPPAADGDRGGSSAQAAGGAPVFYDMPEMLVNLNTGGRASSFLKLQVSLELDGPATVAPIEQVLPRIVDNFQVYLRELRPDELSGSAGIYRLKEELLVRVNTAAQPAKVRDILFKEILIQ